MYRQTFDALAKYFARENKTTVVFDTDGGARADLKTDTVHLPKEISKDSALGALSLLMHESAHVKYSKVIPVKDIVKSDVDFNILNATEDVRIDIENFKRLPNIKEFYVEGTKKIDLNKANTNQKILCKSILELEGLNGWEVPLERKNRLSNEDLTKVQKVKKEMREMVTTYIPLNDWDKVRLGIKNIKKILKIKPEDEKKVETSQLMTGSSIPNDSPGSLNVNEIMRPGELFGKGETMAGPSEANISTLAMNDQTVQSFKEILNIKEKKVVENGTILDTASLVSFFTGDIKELLKEEKIIKKKKSKIMFLLDASGSMAAPMLDKSARYKVVSSCVKKMTEILDEVSMTEGIDVDWDIGMFRDYYIKLTKNNWATEYHPRDGTKFGEAFIQCMKDMLEDYTINGKKIIIAFTDGDVEDDEIYNVKKSIMDHFSDVRALIIGVGSKPHGKLAEEIVGDNVIMSKDNADIVLLNTIESML